MVLTMSDSFQRYWCEISVNHVWNLPASLLDLTWGVSLSRTIRPSPWSFVRFFIPATWSVHFFCIYSFKLWIIMISRSQLCVDNKLSKSNVYFQSLIQSPVRRRYNSLTSSSIMVCMSIVTKIIFIYNNRLTLWMNGMPRGVLQATFLAIDKPFLHQQLPPHYHNQISHP